MKKASVMLAFLGCKTTLKSIQKQIKEVLE